jgi:hypothetical protein
MQKVNDDGKTDFERETENNMEVFKKLVKEVRPDIYVLMDIIDQTKINPFILVKYMRQLNNIAIGNKYGSVTTQIENGVVTFIRGEESDKLNEPILIERPKI